jgi:monomeric sarcosine oxidase
MVSVQKEAVEVHVNQNQNQTAQLKHFDVIVIGAGSMGMAAGYSTAKQGLATLMIDAFDPPHVFGSHHGDTRIIRHAYAEGKEYVPLLLRAQQLWNQLESETGNKLFHQTGVLSVGRKNTPYIETIMDSARQYGLPLELLEAREICRRWPGIRLEEDFIGCLETSSGVLKSEVCVQSYKDLALAHGAKLLTGQRVRAIELAQSGTTVRTDEGTFLADRIIVSAGAWVPYLLETAGIHAAVQPTRKTVGWFESDAELYHSSCFPAFIFQLDRGTFYGFPDMDGGGVKVGRHDGGLPVHPDEVNRQFGVRPEDEGDLRMFLETCMPQAAGSLREGKVCLYSMTPDEDFIVDVLPEHPHAVILAGFSGHGFKFSSVMGEIAAQLLTEGRSSFDLSSFSITRPALAGRRR